MKEILEQFKNGFTSEEEALNKILGMRLTSGYIKDVEADIDFFIGRHNEDGPLVLDCVKGEDNVLHSFHIVQDQYDVLKAVGVEEF